MGPLTVPVQVDGVGGRARTALDDAWKAKMNDVLWRQVKKKNVLDFSKWKTKAFEPQFQKLVTGLKIYYEPA